MRAAVLLVLYYIISCRVDRFIKNAPEPLGAAKLCFQIICFKIICFIKIIYLKLYV